MTGAPGLGRPVALVGQGPTIPFAEGVQRLGELEVDATAVERNGGMRVTLEVRNPQRDSVILDRIGVRFDARPEVVLEHGYQSWSVVRRCRAEDVRPERTEQPQWVRAMYLADADAAGHCVTGDQFLVTDAGVVGFLDGRRHLGSVTADGIGVSAWALLDGVALGPGEARVLDPVWCAAGDPGPLYSRFAAQWGAEAGARLGDAPPLGWCSWYQYFGQVTPADVRANLSLAAAHGLGLVQIDDGYQAAVGDWLSASEEWQEGTAALAGDIRAAGLAAGIWTAPFLAAEDSALVADHPDWLARDERGNPLRAMFNPLAWGGWALALDTTNPAFGDHLRAVFAELRAQGFWYHKIDFCFAAAVAAIRMDRRMTRAEALRAGLQAVRDGIGDDAFLLGCGCPFGPAVGLVDAMRVSPDVAPYWASALSFPGFEECFPAAVNAVSADVLRAPLHRRVFLSDPDCLLLRDDQSQLDARQREVLAAVVAGTAGATILSDDLALYRARQWEQVAEVRTRQVQGDGPLDLADPFAPVVTVASPSRALRIDWRDAALPEALWLPRRDG